MDSGCDQSALLQALGNELPAGRVSTGGVLASLPGPPRRETVPAGDSAADQVAAAVAAARREAAPAGR